MMKKCEGILTFLTVLLLGAGFVLPSGMANGLLYLSTFAALPDGGAVQLRSVMRQPATEAVSAAIKQETIPESTELTDTPADILQWIEQAKSVSDEKKDGTIREVQHGENWATERFGELFIRNQTEDVQPDYQKAWDADAVLQIDKSEPAVLIYHTHTTEGYETLDRNWYAADVTSRTEDTDRNVARVGTAIAAELERAGFRVIHDKTVHDVQYTGAYDRSRATVEPYLRQYPNLSVALDVHRDAIQEDNGAKIKPTAVINGKKSAQIMIISGAEGGNVTDFPNWEQNLSFALRLQNACETASPGLMRPIFFCHRRYNMDMTPCSLLVEFGSEANTLEEAVYAGRLFGSALADLLEKYVV